jgi:hypothetical protein
MTPPVLQDLRAIGVALWPSTDQLQLLAPPEVLTAEMRAAVSAAKPALLAVLELEVRWREEAMRRQVQDVKAPTFWPFLVARPGPTHPGACLSCGEPVLAVEHSRCTLCLEAVHRTMAAAK